jgi:hypothetical protein
VTTGKITCVARLGGKRLALVRRGFRSGQASCSWRLPTSAAGRSVLGWIRADALGSFTRRYFGRPVI